MTIEGLSRLRQGIYRLTSAGLSHPTPELITTAAGALPIFDGLGLFDYAFAPDLADATVVLGESDIEELSIAYVSLFEAGVGDAACPPYEAAHRANSRTGGVAELQSQLKRSILGYGLKLDDRFGDMVDHAATELDIMAMLCRRESEMRTAGRSRASVIANETEFLRNHILTWIPMLAGMVHVAARHPAYTALAVALRSFLAHERQLVPLLNIEADVRS